ncbi:MAG: carbohydrate binding family 9 domain-containing protein [Gemmatimonadota bacterium]|nr:carbohydrate binding family 9 domain-containing protein [Gemmatimonadota bacterium]
MIQLAAIAALLIAIPAAGQASPTAPPATYNGRQHQIRVAPPRLDADVTIDGKLDEPQWQQAARLTGFSQYAPSDGVPAADSTDILVWYSPTAMYLGVRAYESHGPVNANLADRDHIDAEDRVEFLLSTFNDGRQAFVFQVNPLGVQADGTLVENGAANNTAGLGTTNNTSNGRGIPDLSADFVWQSKGRVTPYGYEVEIRIPFKSIRYQASAVQDWGFNVTRHVKHSGHDDSWAPASRAAASFLGQSGTLVGLTDIHRGLVLDFNPEITQTATGAPRTTGYGYTLNHANVGGNVRWGVTNNLTLNATVKPDFSQVEADADQLSYDPRQALYFAERRPFFLDGIEQFTVPSGLIYTRRIVQPTAATKLTGTLAGFNVAFLGALDDPSSSLSGNTHPAFAIARVQRNLGSDSRFGMLYTDREEGSNYNRVAGADTRIVFGDIYTLSAQAAGSETQLAGRHFAGPLWNLSLDRNGRTFGLNYSIHAIDPQFQTQSGFISRGNLANVVLSHRMSVLGSPGALVENFTGVVGLMGEWQYRRLLGGDDMLNKKLHFDLAATLRGGWQLGAGFYSEVFGYDPSIYSNYRVVLPGGALGMPGVLDTAQFFGRKRIPNHDYVLSVNTPQGAHLSANVSVVFGQDEDFYEWEQAAIYFLNLGISWRPTTQLRVDGTYALQRYDRRNDGTTVAQRQIPHLKIEYQLSRAVFLRLVTEYDTQNQSALLSEHYGGAPILFYNPADGTYTPATSSYANRVHLQGLFSYQPVPGTVFFAGYGSLLDEPTGLRLTDYNRLSDGFFLKLSYLFRAR